MTRAYGLALLFPERDTVIGASLREFGEFARPEMELIAAHLARFDKPGCYIDVGGNIGAIALPIAAQHPGWRVIAVEAHRGLAGVLAANALNNQLYNVETIHAAAGAEAGLARFPSASLSAQGNFGILGMYMNEKAATEAVRMCTLDEIAPADTRFVKIDVEGFETEVLKGAQALIEGRGAGWLLEAHKAERERTQATMRVFQDAGYRLFWFFAPFVTGLAKKKKPAGDAISGDLNFVALPPDIPNLWELPLADIDGVWPGSVAEFPYLSRYGFRA